MRFVVHHRLKKENWSGDGTAFADPSAAGDKLKSGHPKAESQLQFHLLAFGLMSALWKESQSLGLLKLIKTRFYTQCNCNAEIVCQVRVARRSQSPCVWNHAGFRRIRHLADDFTQKEADRIVGNRLGVPSLMARIAGQDAT
ncbi:MAG: hypothetical protein WBD31_21300 [Rubripirellula sp.]